jgi:hypothetical protein
MISLIGNPVRPRLGFMFPRAAHPCSLRGSEPTKLLTAGARCSS